MSSLFILRILGFYFRGFVCSIIFLLIESKWLWGTVWLGKRNLHCECFLDVFLLGANAKKWKLNEYYLQWVLSSCAVSFYCDFLLGPYRSSRALFLIANLSAVSRIMNNSNKLKWYLKTLTASVLQGGETRFMAVRWQRLNAASNKVILSLSLSRCLAVAVAFVILAMMLAWLLPLSLPSSLSLSLCLSLTLSLCSWCHANLHLTFYVCPTQNEMR